MTKRPPRERSVKASVGVTVVRSGVVAGALLLALASGGEAQAYQWRGQVRAVYDGDTLLVRPEGQRRSKLVRLHGVDAPEWEQRYGHTAGNFVARLLLWEWVTVEDVEADIYGRDVAVIHIDDGTTLNERLLQEGLAWVYRSFIPRALYYRWIPLERAARDAQRGLWRDKDPTPPWVWRRYHY